MRRRSFLAMLPGALAVAEPAPRNRPKVPGTLALRARNRTEEPPGSGQFKVSERALRWEVA